MNKGIIFGIGTVIGAVLGAGSCYFFLKKKFDKDLDTEVEKFKSEWVKLTAGDNYISEEEEEGSNEALECPSEAISGPSEALNDSETGEKRPEFYKGLIDGLTYGKFDYTKPYKKGHDEQAVAEYEGKKVSTGPYILPDSELWDENNSYEKIEVIYYSHDQVFTDYADRELVIDHNNIGTNNIDYLEDPDNNVNLIYVMNEEMGTIYEISIERKSYTDDVLPTLDFSEDNESDS